MTWIELIDELRKQPLYLLEREVSVWLNYVDADGTQLDFMSEPAYELTSPYQDGSFDDWLRNSSNYLSLCADLSDESVRSIVKTFNRTTKG